MRNYPANNWSPVDYAIDFGRYAAVDAGSSLASVVEAANMAPQLAPAYGGRILGAPLFIGSEDRASLSRGLRGIHDLLVSLPDRFFDGSRVDLGRRLGIPSVQRDIISCSSLPSSSEYPVLARADLYRSGGKFKILEMNITSALGGFENSEVCREFLKNEVIESYVRMRDLEVVDTFGGIVRTVRHHCGLRGEASSIKIALADWPASFRSYAPRLKVMASLFERHGINAVPCDVRDLDCRADGVYLHGARIDLVYRFFLLEEIVTKDDLALISPLVDAFDRGVVDILAPLDSELYGNKGALALLSEAAATGRLSDTERELVDEFVPWTRLVEEVVPDSAGRSVDTPVYAAKGQDEMLLKPINEHGGSGVELGWMLSPEEWSRKVDAAIGGAFVLQERVTPDIELLFEPGDAVPSEARMNWGGFIGSSDVVGGDGFIGCLGRGVVGSEPGVIAMGNGAMVACTFSAAMSPAGDRFERGVV